MCVYCRSICQPIFSYSLTFSFIANTNGTFEFYDTICICYTHNTSEHNAETHSHIYEYIVNIQYNIHYIFCISKNMHSVCVCAVHTCSIHREFRMLLKTFWKVCCYFFLLLQQQHNRTCISNFRVVPPHYITIC